MHQKKIINKNNLIFLTIVTICFFFAYLTMNPLSEDDLFMQIRVGKEIYNHFVKTHTFLDQETLSFTISGTSVVFYQWLSMCLFFIIEKFFSLKGLLVLRTVLVFLFFALISKKALESSQLLKTKTINHLFYLLFILPLSFIILLPRIQLRPEFLCLILFGLIVFYGEKIKFRTHFFILLLWANLHTGTVFFGIIVSILHQVKIRTRISVFFLKIFLLISTIFLTPYHVKVIDSLMAHFNYDTQFFFNSEFQPLQLMHLNFEKAGFAVLFWISSLGFLVFSIKKTLLKASLEFLTHPFKKNIGLILDLCFSALLLVLSVQKIRTLPYLFLFIFPIFSKRLSRVFAHLKYEHYFLIPIPLFCLVPILNARKSGWSSPLWQEQIPSRLFSIIEEEKPQKQLFTSFTSSNFQLYKLSNYPVFVDPRDVLYDEIKPLYNDAFKNPEAMGRLLDHYQIQTVLIEVPKFSISTNGQSKNALRLFFKKENWALRDFNSRWVLLYRRSTPEHQTLLAKSYEHIEPSLSPHQWPSMAASSSIETKKALAQEINRCIQTDGKNLTCLLAASAWMRMNQNLEIPIHFPKNLHAELLDFCQSNLFQNPFSIKKLYASHTIDYPTDTIDAFRMFEECERLAPTAKMQYQYEQQTRMLLNEIYLSNKKLY